MLESPGPHCLLHNSPLGWNSFVWSSTRSMAPDVSLLETGSRLLGILAMAPSVGAAL